MTAAKAYKGIGMTGMIANWYATNAVKRLDQYKLWAQEAAWIAPGKEVLEVAPGPGLFSIELAQLGAYKITGLDISQTFVDIARKNAEAAGVDVDFRQGNASQMPFPDAHFDFVFCSAAFKNFTDPVGALREMYRVLKPGGKAWVIDLRKDAPADELDSAIESMGSTGINKALNKIIFRTVLLKRAYTKRQMEQLVEQAGIRSATITEKSIGVEILLTK